MSYSKALSLAETDTFPNAKRKCIFLVDLFSKTIEILSVMVK